LSNHILYTNWHLGLKKGTKPIIISQPPALRSSHGCAHQAYCNVETERTVYKWDGPTREPREGSESGPKRERSASEDVFKSMGTTRKAPSSVYEGDTIIISSSSPTPPSSYLPSVETEVYIDHSPRPLRGGSKRKAVRPPPSVDDSDFDSDPVTSTHQTKKKRGDYKLSMNKGTAEPPRDNKGKKAADRSEGGYGRKMRASGKARIKSVASRQL
jgi:hypothetical protein